VTYPKGWPPTETTKVTWDTGGQVLKGLDEVSLASYVVGIARALVGLGANPADPARRRAYLDLIGPFNAPHEQADMARKSGCGLTTLGLLRCCGIGNGPDAGREVWAPYRSGFAFTDLGTIGLRCHARKNWDTEPVPADIVIIGTDPPAGASPEVIAQTRAGWGMPGHAIIVTSVIDGREVETVEGGQLDEEGFQIVKAKRRPIIRKGSQVWIGDRRVYAVVRVREMGQWMTEGATWPML